ncbi:MAG TPA: hypothetical protein VGN12_25420 [Pirellulales bacterium]|jgi:hypothetical protein
MSELPNLGDRMFVPINTDMWSGMEFHRFIGFQRAYVVGFKHAADSLIESVIQEGGRTLDERVIPACHLYRHYVELHLKYILCEGRTAGHVAFKNEDIQNHSVYHLWQATKRLMLLAFPEEPADRLAATELLLKDVYDCDPSGQESRYHETRGGKASLSQLPNLYDLPNQLRMMAKLEKYFEEWVLVFQCQFEDEDFHSATPPLELFPSKESPEVH